MRSDAKIAIVVGLVAVLVTAYYFTRNKERPRDVAVLPTGAHAALTPPPTAAKPMPTHTPTMRPAPSATPYFSPTPFRIPAATPAIRVTMEPTTRLVPRPATATPTPFPMPSPTAAPTSTPKVEQPIIHVLEAGETMRSIAEHYYGDAKFWGRIAKANPKVNPNRLKVGDKLTIEPKIWFDRPGTRPTPGPTVKPGATPKPTVTPKATGTPRPQPPETYIVRPGDTLIGISRKIYGTPKRHRDIYEANKHIIGDDETGLRAGMKLNIPE